MSWNKILRMISGSDSNEKKRKIQKKSDGVLTQFVGTSEESTRKQLIIGLDFGTAFTKVVVGEAGGKFAIPLRGEGEKSADYLLPSVFWLNADGDCYIDAPNGRLQSDLKMALIEGNADIDCICNIIAYISLVFRKIRSFIFEKKHGMYGDKYIDWFINVGLPTDSYHDDKLSSIYQQIILLSWVASATPGLINIAAIKQLYTSADSIDNDFPDLALHADVVSLFPEFVAQITGYVRSPLRQKDLHLLIDVGAGTLDVTIFNVHEKDGDDFFPIFAKAVEPLGTRFLTRKRIENTSLREEKSLAPFAPVPSDKEFAELLNITTNQLRKIDQPFRDKVLEMVIELLKFTKLKRYSQSQKWTLGIPLFLCGGGSKCDFYSKIFKPRNKSLGIFPISIIKLPKPESLESPGLSTDDYDRVSVAYGLSFEPFEIGEIIKSDEIRDGDDGQIQRPQTRRICPHCNGTGGLHRPCPHCNQGFI